MLVPPNVSTPPAATIARLSLTFLVFCSILQSPVNSSANECENLPFWIGGVDLWTGTEVNSTSMAVLGDRLYVADQRFRSSQVRSRFHVVDLSATGGPELLGGVDLTGICCFVRGVAAKDEFVLVASQDGVLTIDVSDPAAPELVATLPGSANDIIISGDIAFSQASGNATALDVSDPLQPQVIGATPLLVGVTEQFLDGDRLYLTGFQNMQIVDASDPTDLQTLGVWTNPTAYDVVASGSYAYVVSEEKLYVVDVSNPSTPQTVGETFVEGDDIALIGNRAYVTTRFDGLTIVDVSNPFSPQKVHRLPVEERGLDVQPWGQNIVSLDAEGEVQVFDVTGTATLPELDDLPVFRAEGMVDTEGDLAFVKTDNFGVAIVDISNPSSMQLLSTYPGGGSDNREFAIDGNLLYVAANGIELVDVSDPQDPQEVLQFAQDGLFVRQIEVIGGRAYVGAFDLRIFDVSTPTSPQELSTTRPIANGIDGIAVSPPYACVFDDRGEFLVVDTSDPTAPAVVGQTDLGEFLRAITIEWPYAFVTTRVPAEPGQSAFSAGGLLLVVDLSDPTSPLVVSSTPLQGAGEDIDVQGMFAAVANRAGGLQVLDITDVTSPRLLGSTFVLSQGLHVALDGDVAYVVGGESLRALSFDCDIVIPVLLSTFDAWRTNVGVALEWELAASSSPAAFRLMGHQGDQQWTVPFSTIDGRRFTALDRIVAGRTDELVYSLQMQQGGSGWSELQETTLPARGVLTSRLLGASPNPFNPSTMIRFELARPDDVSLSVYDMAGRRLRQLVRQQAMQAGPHEVAWDGLDGDGFPLASGTYVARLEAGGETSALRLTLVK